jgi:hypothetical protein
MSRGLSRFADDFQAPSAALFERSSSLAHDIPLRRPCIPAVLHEVPNLLKIGPNFGICLVQFFDGGCVPVQL